MTNIEAILIYVKSELSVKWNFSYIVHLYIIICVRVCVGSSTNPRSAFPLVRRSATSSGSENVPATRALPRLMSLELFNPETDDMDSDSSGVSSPDSVGSVISVLNDDDHPVTQGKQTSTAGTILLCSTSSDQCGM